MSSLKIPCSLLARARDPAHLSRMRAHDLCIPAGERSCPEDVMGDEPREENAAIKLRRRSAQWKEKRGGETCTGSETRVR